MKTWNPHFVENFWEQGRISKEIPKELEFLVHTRTYHIQFFFHSNLGLISSYKLTCGPEGSFVKKNVTIHFVPHFMAVFYINLLVFILYCTRRSVGHL